VAEAGDDGLICAYLMDGRGSGRQVGWAEIGRWQPADGLLWVHLDFTRPGSRTWLEESSGLDESIVEALLAEDGRPRSLDSLSLSADAAAALAGLPFASLGGWLLGDFSSAGEWSPDVLAWTGAGGWRLPRTLTFSHPRAALRVAILDWELPGPKPQ